MAQSGPEFVVDKGVGVHPVVNAVHLAFAGHRPLTLTPDAIWTTIAQGFALHIRLNAEDLRRRFVEHEGKKPLAVERGEYPASSEDWSHVVSDWCQQIRMEVGTGAADFFVNDFSTSGPIERTASEIVMMDAFERYFEYTMNCICGIPTIELTGTAEDWREIRRRIELMAEYGVDAWIAGLRGICDQFVESACGRPDRDFWQCVYKPREAYGGAVFTGWLGRLFPYLETEGGFHPNATIRVEKPAVTPSSSRRNASLFPFARSREQRPHAGDIADDAPSRRRWISGGVTPSSIPNGLSRVPATLALVGQPYQDLELIGGLTGVVQNPRTLALEPVLGWAVRTRPAFERTQRSREETLEALRAELGVGRVGRRDH